MWQPTTLAPEGGAPAYCTGCLVRRAGNYRTVRGHGATQTASPPGSKPCGWRRAKAYSTSVSILHALHDLEEEPLPALGQIENILQQVGGHGVAVLVADGDGRTLQFGDMLVVLEQPAHPLARRDKVLGVVGDRLQLADVRNAADGGAT